MEDFGGDFLRGVNLVAHFDVGQAIFTLDDFKGDVLGNLFDIFRIIALTHQTLDGKNGVFRIKNHLTLGDIANQTLDRFDNRGKDIFPFGGRNNFGFAAFHNGDGAKGGAEIDTNDFSHMFLF